MAPPTEDEIETKPNPSAGAPVCGCTACDERAGVDRLLERAGARQITTVRTLGATPEYKSLVCITRDDELGRGQGNSEPSAIVEALRMLGVR